MLFRSLHDYLLGWPGQTAALLAVELCSLNWPTSGITPADMVASGLFGDGAVALIARGGQADAVYGPGPGPRVIASRSAVYPDSGDALGWRLSAAGFRIVLTTELPVVVERGLSDSVTGFLVAPTREQGIGTRRCPPAPRPGARRSRWTPRRAA